MAAGGRSSLRAVWSKIVRDAVRRAAGKKPAFHAIRSPVRHLSRALSRSPVHRTRGSPARLLSRAGSSNPDAVVHCLKFSRSQPSNPTAMKELTQRTWPQQAVLSGLFDVVGVALIYLVPAISHTLSLPIYLYEPMRLVLVAALAHTHRWNAAVLAFTLPLMSYLLSGHPTPFKACLISGELALNVGLYFLLLKPLRSQTLALLVSILCSKVGYYIGKYYAIRLGFIEGELFSTPFYFQGITVALCSGYFLFLELVQRFSRKRPT
jgi:hypothetical protein